MSTVPSFITLLNTHASQARYYRSSDTGIPCPCQTPEKFRDPEFHLSLLSYGPTDTQIEAGPIPAGNYFYSFVAVGFSGVASAPMVQKAISPSTPFQARFTIHWPSKGQIEKFAVYRAVAAQGPFLKIGEITRPSSEYLDNAVSTSSISLTVPVLCNEAGEISSPVDVIVKAFVQPIQSTRATRLSTEYIEALFGHVEADDHLGIFPVVWGGRILKFYEWSQSGDDFVEYDGERFFVINANMIPDPGDGNPQHHWELGLRKIDEEGLSQ